MRYFADCFGSDMMSFKMSGPFVMCCCARSRLKLPSRTRRTFSASMASTSSSLLPSASHISLVMSFRHFFFTCSRVNKPSPYLASVCRQSISDSWLGNLRECLAHLVKGSGCDCLLMQAASLLDGFSFDLFPPFENGLAAPEVDVSRRQVVQALVVSTVVVVPDELLDVLFELSWQVVVVQQNPVFHRAMISLDLALRHRVVRPAADMSDAVVLKPLTKLARHVGWTVIAQQPWPMQNLDLVQT